jgi:hypothetical protein
MTRPVASFLQIKLAFTLVKLSYAESETCNASLCKMKHTNQRRSKVQLCVV